MNKKIKNVNNILLNIFILFLSIVLLIFIYTGLQVKFLNQDYANFFGYSLFEVKTNSMKPAIDAGDWIIVKITKDVKLNDVITYKKDDNFITHRVKEVHANSIIAKGDANNGEDKPVAFNNIVGVQTKRLPKFGLFRKTIFNPYVLIIMIAMLYLLESILKDHNNKDKKASTNKISSKVNELKNKFLESKKAEDNLFKEEVQVTNQKEEEIKVEKPEVEEALIEEPEAEDESSINEIKIDDTSLEEDLKESLEEDLKDEDHEETKFFRMITVNVDENDKDLLEMAEKQLVETEDVEKPVVEEKVIEEEIDEDSLTNIDITLIKKKLKKHKNVLDGFVNIKTEELNDLVELITKGSKPLVNEATIRTKLTEVYINARYYNYYYEVDLNYKGRNPLIMYDRILKHFKEDLTKKYNGPDDNYKEKAHNNYLIFKLISKLERGDEKLSELKLKREFYKEEIEKVFKEYSKQEIADIAAGVVKINKAYEKVLNEFTDKVKTKDFEINETEIKDKTYSADLVHNINFNKAYSDYIIDKTYYEGVIAEDKLFVLLNMLSVKLIDHMKEKSFDEKYIIYVPDTLYSKKQKVKRVYNLIDDEYAKKRILTLIDYKVLAKNKATITNLRKKGLKFVCTFNGDEKLLAKDKKVLYLVEKIYISKDLQNKENIKKFIPKDLSKNIISYNIKDNYSKAEER